MTPDEILQIRAHVLQWINYERREYADVKYSRENGNLDIVLGPFAEADFSDRTLDFVVNYIKRSQLFGIDTEQGRQALGKAVVTILHFLEVAVEFHGPMPKPGVPSGEIDPWDPCPVPLPERSP